VEISVKLFGGLRQFLPAGSSFNQCRIAIDDGASLEALLGQIPIPADKPFLVILNDQKVDPENYAGIEIDADDDVVLLPPIKGG
jgi:sulfur carrier protein ThiS